MDILSPLLLWITCWVVVKGGFYYFSKSEGYYINKTVFTAFYFLIASFIGYLLFQKYLDRYFLSLHLFDYVLLLLFIFCLICIYWFAPKLFSLEQLNTNKYIFTRFSKRYLFAKMFEIIFQQILIITLASLLAQAGGSELFIYTFFALLFGIIHLPLIKIRGKHIGIYFTIASFFAGFLFPYLIFNFTNGVVYSFMLHWSFYIISALIYNVFVKRKRLILEV